MLPTGDSFAGSPLKHGIPEPRKATKRPFTLAEESSGKRINSKKSINPETVEKLNGLIKFFLDITSEFYQPELKKIIQECEKKGPEHLLTVEELDLGGLRLTQIPESIGLLENLRKLILTDNQLTSLPSSLRSLHKLRSVKMEVNKFKEIPRVIQEIARERMSEKHYFEMYLNRNPLERDKIPSDLKRLIRTPLLNY